MAVNGSPTSLKKKNSCTVKHLSINYDLNTLNHMELEIDYCLTLLFIFSGSQAFLLCYVLFAVIIFVSPATRKNVYY